MEGITELGYDFELISGIEDGKFDIIVIAPDRLDKAVGYTENFGAVPVLLEGTEEFMDFDPIKEVGNSFVYEDSGPWQMLAALMRAVETYKFEYDWKVLKQEINDTLMEV